MSTCGKIQDNSTKAINLIAPTWNDEFEMADGSHSVSNIQVHIEYIIKNCINH